jgi:hypothetical protein
MMKRSLFSFPAAVVSFVTGLVVWFVLDADPHLKTADAKTSTAVPSSAATPERFKTAHAANQTTTRILALEKTKRLAFWTFVLKSKKQACNVVVRAMYQGRTESGIDSWSIGCQDGNEYWISIDPDGQGSVCNRNTFA